MIILLVWNQPVQDSPFIATFPLFFNIFILGGSPNPNPNLKHFTENLNPYPTGNPNPDIFTVNPLSYKLFTGNPNLDLFTGNPNPNLFTGNPISLLGTLISLL